MKLPLLWFPKTKEKQKSKSTKPWTMYCSWLQTKRGEKNANLPLSNKNEEFDNLPLSNRNDGLKFGKENH